MKRSLSLALLSLVLLGAKAVFATGGESATITLTEPEPVSGDVTYAVTETNMPNPYEGWVRQTCFLGADVVDDAFQAVIWDSVVYGNGHHNTGTGHVTFQTSGIHEGSGGSTPWSSDRCEAYVWDWPDLTPISAVLSFSVA